MQLKSPEHLLTLLSFLVGAAGAAGAATSWRDMEKRQFQTDAVCDTSYVWASNSKQQTPCIVAAYVNGACGTNTYRVTKLTDGNRYNAPNATNANPCSCSWASYNLLSACTACQNMAQSIPTWDAWVYQCSSYLSNSYFPADITLASGTSIPFYAGTNPESWPNHQFDPVQAKAIAAENNGDLSPNEENESSSSTPIGPIVGGVVGGLAIVVIAIVVVVWLTRRRRQREKAAHEGPQFDPTPTPFHSTGNTLAPPLHLRSLSDMSQKTLGSTAYMSTFSPSSPTSPSVIMTHVSAPSTQYANSESGFTEFGLVHPPSIYSSPSPPPLPTNSSGGIGHEHIIEPYRLVTSVNSHGRTESRTIEKGGMEGGQYPIYDNPSSPPGIPPIDLMEAINTNTSPGRRRMNPPAYSPPQPASPQMLAQAAPIGTQSGPSEGPSAWTTASPMIDGKGRRVQGSISRSQREYDPSVMSPSPTVVTGSGIYAEEPDDSVVHGAIGSEYADQDAPTTPGGQTVATGASDFVYSTPSRKGRK
ncbi:hypothetical protein EYR40_004602 [Pleurotus pulmonarius]|nr:hypothetical protein EYR38_001833 [Pleurotus pulmonarius]KAF4605812.1 hypothetical protein EYR40_004602 [Pleurotus pulmonarius]